ncbi:MAG: hypothetical protein P8X51_17715 [Maritimibacter sp.]
MQAQSKMTAPITSPALITRAALDLERHVVWISMLGLALLGIALYIPNRLAALLLLTLGMAMVYAARQDDRRYPLCRCGAGLCHRY